MFEQIQGKFNRILKVLKGHGKIKESNIDDALREVRRALLEADVNYKVVAPDTLNDTKKDTIYINYE